MNEVGKFEEVSIEQFKRDFYQQNIETYNISFPELPKQSIVNINTYDFFAPFDIKIPYGESVIIPTGIKCKIKEGWFLDIFLNSNQDFKYDIEIYNEKGTIDSEYYDNDNNEGHIIIKVTNKDTTVKKELEIKTGQTFCQGMFKKHNQD